MFARTETWLGKNVFVRDDARPRIGSRPVDRSDLPAPTAVKAVQGEWLWLGRAWVRMRDVMSAAEAVEYYTVAIRRNRRSVEAWFQRGRARRALGSERYAERDFGEVLRLAPDHLEARFERGGCRHALGAYDDALEDFDVVIQKNPRYAAAYHRRGDVWRSKNRLENATADYSRAIELDSTVPEFYTSRGLAYVADGRFEAAVADFQTAIKLDPQNFHPYAGLARLHFDGRGSAYHDLNKAVEFALKANDLCGGKDPRTLDVLAKAYAALGDFPRAVEYQTLAVAVAPEGSRSSYEETLELYREGRTETDAPYN